LYVPQPPSNLDLASSDFGFLGDIQNSLIGQGFDEPDESLLGITTCLDAKIRWILENNRDYYYD
jgi:hypothetical protein